MSTEYELIKWNIGEFLIGSWKVAGRGRVQVSWVKMLESTYWNLKTQRFKVILHKKNRFHSFFCISGIPLQITFLWFVFFFKKAGSMDSNLKLVGFKIEILSSMALLIARKSSYFRGLLYNTKYSRAGNFPVIQYDTTKTPRVNILTLLSTILQQICQIQLVYFKVITWPVPISNWHI